MTYRVVITTCAKDNLLADYRRAAEQAPTAASRWLGRFEKALHGLAKNPTRCGLAPENDALPVEIRQLLFGRGRSVYRAIFTIDQDEVRILHIRRGVRDVADEGEILPRGSVNVAAGILPGESARHPPAFNGQDARCHFGSAGRVIGSTA